MKRSRCRGGGFESAGRKPASVLFYYFILQNEQVKKPRDETLFLRTSHVSAVKITFVRLNCIFMRKHCLQFS